MEKIQDFFASLTERFNNPIIFSFIFSWLVINWRIPIALLFYNQDGLLKDNYISFIDLIAKQHSISCFYVWPFIASLGYTFLFPYAKVWIASSNTWYNKKTNDKVIEITGEASIPFTAYWELEQSLGIKQRELSDALTRGKEFEKIKEKLESENIDAKEEIQKLRSDHRIITSTQQEKIDNQSRELREWIAWNDYRILEGIWRHNKSESVILLGNKSIEFRDNRFIIDYKTYTIINQLGNPRKGKIVIQLETITPDAPTIWVFINVIQSTAEAITGIEISLNDSKKQTYTKLHQSVHEN